MAAEALKAGDQALPKRIGRYEAFLQIGAGGMARVYLAVQRGTAGQKAELVVLKLLRPEVTEDEHILSLFTDEARIAMRLQHPNVIRTREVIAGPPDYLLAMDFHNGRSLLDVVNRLGRDAVPLDEHVYVLAKVLAGLSYAHELKDESGRPFGIVHRDVSPANVLVSYGGEVKLLDFGIAKATGALAATRDGVVRGKLGYAAPEQCLGQPADPRSDVYAVGVMLWEAIAGRRRVTAETWQSVLQARLNDAEPALEEVCPDAPPALSAIVRRAIARVPDDRYSSAKEFQSDLEKYLREKAISPIGPARIAAMLKPHFEQDRAELHRSTEAFLQSLKSAKTGQLGRMPLPGGRAAPRADLGDTAPPTAPAPREETTAPIPVDSALLMLSRGEAEMAPGSSMPTAPPPPMPLTTTAPPPPGPLTTPPAPLATTARPPPDAEAVPPSAARPSVKPTSLALDGVEPAAPSLAFDSTAPSPPAAAAVLSPATASSLPKPPVSVDTYGLVPSNVPVPRFQSSAAPAPLKKTPMWPFLLIGLGALGLGAVVMVPRLNGSKDHAATASSSTSAESAPTAAKSAAPKVDTVTVRISVDPADAVITLDGRTLSGNPFVANLPRDNLEHALSATAEGCKDQQQTVRLNSNLALLVALKCQRIGMRLSAKPGARRAPAPAAEGPLYPQPVQPPAAAPEPVSGDNPY